ncbi:MAG: glycoside hydrolase family 15 protein [Methanomassiliicoccales archaeon]
MPRDLPLSNSKLLICFDNDYLIRDIYYPHVGSENHAMGHKFRLGVWVNGTFSWIDAPGWDKRLDYRNDTLVTDVTLRNPALGVTLKFNDAVDFVVDAFLRRIELSSDSKDAEVRLFFHHDYHIYGNDVGDTAYFDPELDAIIHYKDMRYFLHECGTEEGVSGISQFACGLKEFDGKEGTWRDAEDGLLSGNPISEGSVDSVIGLSVVVPAGEKREAFYFMAAGENYHAVEKLQALIRKRGVDHFIERTAAYWKLWSNKEPRDFSPLPPEVVRLYRRSLLTVMTNIDRDGGVLAGNDTDLLRFNRDTYSYIWPRDGAMVAMALDNAGYNVPAGYFFSFCANAVSSKGYFLQKYNPDGSFASSWHPWVLEDKPSLPIQEDETGLVLYALWNHFSRYRDVEFIKPMYKPLIKTCADFMCSYIDTTTNLPLDSYDLWEERRGVFTYTCSAVYAGLMAAASFATSFGEDEKASRYSSVASSIRKGMINQLYMKDKGRFARGILTSGRKGLDEGVDASLAGLFYLGVFAADDPMIAGTMKAVGDTLWVRGPIGGIARYDGDWYQRDSANASVQGNPWFICTLWLADYYIAIAKSRQDLSKALELIKWTVKYATPSGILSEQLDPRDGHQVSVSPLTWSHAALIDTVDRYLKRYGELR